MTKESVNRYELAAKRRNALLRKMKKNSVAILPAATLKTRSNDTEYNFRQDSDFYYLTGFTEDNAVLVLKRGDKDTQTILFCQPKDKTKELWTGILTGPKKAVALLNIDSAYSVTEIDSQLPELLADSDLIYYRTGLDSHWDKQVNGWVNQVRRLARQGVQAPSQFAHIDPIIHEMRLIKSADEIALMQKAADISARAHCRAMLASRAGVTEYQLEAELQHEFLHSGASAPAYSSIVASGANACILHYIENRATLRNGDLVLIDAGCEYEHYAADITRTYPVSGRFSKEQSALYEIVLKAQLAAIDAVKPGNPADQPHQVATRIITEGLVELGLLKGKPATLIQEGAYRDFFMHGTGHWLGIDVHDVGAYKTGGKNNATSRPFQPGMVTTIEPGIYVAPDNRKVAKKWRGIGIRIEDDVLVTRSGNRVLTDGVPKTISEIEALMATRQES
ncbi:MAG: Xaa-Pro aminopeptidase [Pseudohongiella nitratireducens]|nr:Xaa-Pro aminopeptidase [Pseudohongiella nitratireducens]MDF1622323.1 Xaa-Pro aminopeptidase [Pseudohongiella nitratireducens]